MPSPFIVNNTRLPFPKSDRAQLPAGAVPEQHLTAAEHNQICQSIIDVRAWLLSGSYYGFVSSSTMPNVQMGLSGTVGSFWLSSSLHPYFTTTSSAGLQTRKVALAPTGTNVWSGWWDMVLVDEQGIVVSGSSTGGGGGGSSSSTASLDFLTRDLTVQRNTYVSGTIATIYLTASVGVKTVDLESTRTSTLATVSVVTMTGSGGIKALDLESSRNLIVAGNANFLSLTGSGGGKFLDLEVTRNFTLTNVTGSSVKATLDLEAARNLLIGGNSSFLSLTGSGGAKFLDLEVTRNFILTNVTASSIKATLDLEASRNLLIGGNSSVVSLTSSGGSKTTDLQVTRYSTVAFLTCSNGSRFQGAYDEFNGDLTVNNKGGVNTFSVVCTSSFLGPSSFSNNVNFVSLTGSGGAKFLDLEITRNFTLTNVTASSIRATLDMSVARSFQANSLTSSNTPEGYIFFAGTNGELRYDSTANGTLFWDATNHRLGIGTNGPQQTLHIADTVSTSKYIRIDAQPGTGYFGVDSSGFCVIQAGTAAKGVAFYNSAGGSPIFNLDSVGNMTGSAFVSTGRIVGSKSADVTSASTITIGAGNYAKITSTTTINYITTTAWQAGSQIMLEFAASLTVTHNAGSVPANTAAILLAGAANFSATSGDTLTLAYDGSTWREIARTVI